MESVPCAWFSRQRVFSCLDLASVCIVVRHFKFSFQILKHTWFVVLYASFGWYKILPKGRGFCGYIFNNCALRHDLLGFCASCIIILRAIA